MSELAVRFDCPGCGPTLAQGFRVIAPRLWLCCARCGREHPAEAPVRSTGADPVASTGSPPARCPDHAPEGTPAAPAGPGGRSLQPHAREPAAPEASTAPPPASTPAASPAPEPHDARAGSSPPPSAPAPAPPSRHPGTPASGDAARAGPGLEILQGGARPHVAAREPDARAALLLPPIPPGICPSCLRERTAMQSRCAGCGLDFLKADPASFAPSDRLSRAWAELAGQWDEPGAHARFLQGARSADELREAARLYRLHLLSSPEDPHARGALEKLVAETLAMAAVSRSDRDGPEALEARRRKRLLLSVLLLSLLFAGLAMMM